MIINCINCNKKFDLNASLIPNNGRLLQCNNCNHKWFFKKEVTNDYITENKVAKPTMEVEIFEKKSASVKFDGTENIELLDEIINENNNIENKPIVKREDKELNLDLEANHLKNKKNYKPLGFIVVFIMSFMALIIVLDTFKTPFSKVIPNFEFLLYNLYEIINDIKLFIKDLI